MDMKTISLTETGTNFQAILRDIASGKELAITYGENKEMIAVIIPYETWMKTKKRQLGSLQDRGSVKFENDFYMTNEEFTSL